ncbi:MAG TPA: DSD1 family PLP-dependent enzyme [Stellaceae bacterium]|nr:DSD1 family PLP-dependent enzyme [Stellaceae bacterium]
MTDLGPNAHLIGVAGSRASLDTPALILDLDIMERNIASMAAHARGVGVNLRPHAKTHKSVKIAELQVQAGALGVCCATLGEAEVMVRAGIPGVHITSPQVTLSKIERLFALNAHDHHGFSVVVDNPTNLTALAAAAQADGKPLDVLVDFYAGHGRTGAQTEEAVLELAWGIGASRVLRFRGLQAYAGNLQHLAKREERRARTLDVLKRLAAIVERLKKEGIPVPIVTGAGTGTFDLDPEAHVFTELQVGSYIFMDVDYNNALREGRNTLPFETSLFVQTAVVSTNAPGYVTCDAGLKAFATDGPKPEIARGAPEGATYTFFGDEHGKLILPEGAPRPEIGHRLECVTPHDDPTVNLYDVYHVVRGDTLVDIWPVDARGKR